MHGFSRNQNCQLLNISKLIPFYLFDLLGLMSPIQNAQRITKLIFSFLFLYVHFSILFYLQRVFSMLFLFPTSFKLVLTPCNPLLLIPLFSSGFYSIFSSLLLLQFMHQNLLHILAYFNLS